MNTLKKYISLLLSFVMCFTFLSGAGHKKPETGSSYVIHMVVYADNENTESAAENSSDAPSPTGNSDTGNDVTPSNGGNPGSSAAPSSSSAGGSSTPSSGGNSGGASAPSNGSGTGSTAAPSGGSSTDSSSTPSGAGNSGGSITATSSNSNNTTPSSNSGSGNTGSKEAPVGGGSTVSTATFTDVGDSGSGNAPTDGGDSGSTTTPSGGNDIGSADTLSGDNSSKSTSISSDENGSNNSNTNSSTNEVGSASGNETDSKTTPTSSNGTDTTSTSSDVKDIDSQNTPTDSSDTGSITTPSGGNDTGNTSTPAGNNDTPREVKPSDNTGSGNGTDEEIMTDSITDIIDTEKKATATDIEPEKEGEAAKEDDTTEITQEDTSKEEDEIDTEVTESDTRITFRVNAKEGNAITVLSEAKNGKSLEDIIPPELLDLILSKTELVAGSDDRITVDLYATDDVSGISFGGVSFKNEETGKSIYVNLLLSNPKTDANGNVLFDSTGYPIEVPAPDGAVEGKAKADGTLPSGKYIINDISITDKAGNTVNYRADGYGEQIPDKFKDLMITIVNTGLADIIAPVLQNITLDSTTLKAGSNDRITVDLYATDDVSGISFGGISFKNEETGKSIYVNLNRYTYKTDANGNVLFDSKGYPIELPAPDGAVEGKAKADTYLPSGDYIINDISITDKAGNTVNYRADGYGNPIPDSLSSIKINVVNEGVADIVAPVLQKILLDKTSIETGGDDRITVDLYATDDVSGVNNGIVSFRNEETGKSIYVNLFLSNPKTDANGNVLFDSKGYPIEVPAPKGAIEGKAKADTYLPSGVYIIDYIGINDKAGNSITYRIDGYGEQIPDFLRNLFIRVINNGYIKKPTPNTPSESNEPSGYQVTNYIPEVTVQGFVEIKSNSNDPGYKVILSKNETFAQLKEALLTVEDRLEIARGKNADITLEFRDGSDKVNAEAKQAVEEAIGNGTIAKWLDIAVFKHIEGHEIFQVEQPNSKVKLQIFAPDEIIQMAASGVPFKLVYVQDGKVIQLPATYNAETNTIDFETDVFAVFALVYDEI